MKSTLLRVSKKILPPKVRFHLIDFYSSAINLIKYGDWNFPQHIWIEISTHCNRKCWYCPNSVKPIPDRFMKREEFDVILRGLQKIKWAGPVGYHYLSEPLLHPDIRWFIWRTKEILPGSLPIIFTNGDYLSVNLAESLVAAGLVKCTITRHKPVMHGWDEMVNRICGLWPDIFDVSDIDKGQLMNMGGALPAVKTPMLPYCNSPKRVLPIRIDGTLALCCCDYQKVNPVGTVEDILTDWQDPWWRRVRQDLRVGIRNVDICKGCTGAQ